MAKNEAPTVETPTAEETAQVAEAAPEAPRELTAQEQKDRKRRRSDKAPEVEDMFSDSDQTEVLDPAHLTEEQVMSEDTPAEVIAEAAEEAEEEARETKKKERVPKESRMSLDTTVVPGKVGLATLTPDKLRALAFISTYSSTDPQSTSPRQHGYQRDPLETRFPGIGRYYAKDENKALIVPLVASARVYTDKDQARFNFLFNKGDVDAIHREFGRSAFSIVDGQHRLGGLFWAWENMEDFTVDVPVMVYYGLNYEQEAIFFDTVNTSQRKLPKALIEATKVHMEAGDRSHAQIVRELAFALAEHSESVWNGLVNMTGARDPNKPVTYEGLRRATSNMMHERLVTRLRLRGFDPEDVLRKYWGYVAKACAPAWTAQPKVVENEEGEKVEVPVKYRLKDLVGVASVSKLGQDIITTSLDKTRTDEDFWESMSELVSKLGAVDWEKRESNPWMASSAGFAGMGTLYQMLYALVYLDRSPGQAVEPDEDAA